MGSNSFKKKQVGLVYFGYLFLGVTALRGIWFGFNFFVDEYAGFLDIFLGLTLGIWFGLMASSINDFVLIYSWIFEDTNLKGFSELTGTSFCILIGYLIIAFNKK